MPNNESSVVVFNTPLAEYFKDKGGIYFDSGNAALCLAAEAGEVANEISRIQFGLPENIEAIKKEMADVYFNLLRFQMIFDVSQEELDKLCVDKLKARGKI